MSEQFYGTILFATEVGPQGLAPVLNAARFAGIDQEEVHSIKPRNAFIRAVRELKSKGHIEKRGSEDILLHRFKDDANVIEFQFSRAYLKTLGVDYDKAAIVRFDKHSRTLSCDIDSVLQVAQQLYAQVQTIYRPSDLHALIKRVVEKAKAKRIPLRDGVYFIAAAYQPVTDQIKKFFTKLDITFYTLPVGASTGEHGNLLRATVTDIRNTVKSIQTEVEVLKADNKLTSKIAKQRLQTLNQELQQYREVAQALGTDITSVLTMAGEAGATLNCTADGLENLVSMIQTGKPTTTLLYDLLEASDPELKLPQRMQFVPVEVEVEDSKQVASVVGAAQVLVDI